MEGEVADFVCIQCRPPVPDPCTAHWAACKGYGRHSLHLCRIALTTILTGMWYDWNCFQVWFYLELHRWQLAGADCGLSSQPHGVSYCCAIIAINEAPYLLMMYSKVHAVLRASCRLILFLNWSLLAHAAVAKLIKKAKKKLGCHSLSTDPSHNLTLDQEFCNTDVSTAEMLYRSMQCKQVAS